MIEVRSLTKTYGTERAVDSISFEVKQGEIVGFLGPNGAGKTTTMKLITGYLQPNEGSVLVDRKDVSEDSLDTRGVIGYLPESTPLYPEMVTYDYLAFVAAMRNIPMADRESRIADMTSACGLHAVLGKRIDALSKGYKQRVGLAQALIHDPPILILDEPTSGLDPNQIVEIRELIKALGKEKTVILSTHILSEVQASCDRVIIIDRGKLVADGSPEDLAQSASSSERVDFSVLEDEEQVAGVLAQWPHAQVVAQSTDAQGEAHFALSADADIRADVYRLAVDHQWTLTGLTRKRQNLEDVFRQLTSA